MISTSPVNSITNHLPSNRTMKELLSQYSAYNVWANQKLLDIILALPEEQQMQELPSSFRSLYSTVLHMWDAESVWWQRIKLQERTIFPSENFKGNMKDVANGLLQQSQQWHDWASTSTDTMLDHVYQYYNSKREHFKQPIFQTLLHVFNHDTYHRGQLVNMLRQLGIEKIPPTDFSVWSRKK